MKPLLYWRSNNSTEAAAIPTISRSTRETLTESRILFFLSQRESRLSYPSLLAYVNRRRKWPCPRQRLDCGDVMSGEEEDFTEAASADSDNPDRLRVKDKCVIGMKSIDGTVS